MSATCSLAIRLVCTVCMLSAGLGLGHATAIAESTRPADTVAAKASAASTPTVLTASAPAATLPNGATSLAEVYADWTVSCSIQSNARHCDAKQEQINQQSRQLVLAVQLVPAGDRVEGFALLPFGLELANGLSLQIDDSSATSTIAFKTCLPTGCVAPMSFDARGLASLRAGTMMKAKVMVDGGTETVLSISLKGFSQAIDRAAALVSAEGQAGSEKVAVRGSSKHDGP